MKTSARRLFAAVTAAAASSASTYTAAAETPPPYPVPDALLGERLYPNEEALARKLSAVIDETVRRQYRTGTARRDAHPKAHGCVRAEFHVDEKLDPRFAKGAFMPGKTYQAWVRFSNGNPDANKPDADIAVAVNQLSLAGLLAD